ncbi:MAG: hypothetical protein RL018_1304 [Pseudomonadota bacterium]|jgi:hypothetical protein
MIVNAFHKDYVQTYMPEFLSTIRKEADAKANGIKYGTQARATRESDGRAKTSALSDFPKTKRVSIERTDFFVYSKAGMPKGVKK